MAKTPKSKSSKSSKSKSKGHKSHFKAMAKLISREWEKYRGNLDYPQFTKKMWKEHGKK